MINNRQNGRRRGRGGQRVGNGAPGRSDNGSRIDNRARGNASQLHEKYRALASEAQRQGDRVNTEYYLQFADHYFRVLNENRPRFDEQNAPRQGDGFDDDLDGDGDEFGNEGEPVRAEQYQPRQDERPRYNDRPRQAQDERPRQGQDERPRYEQRPRQGADQAGQGQDDGQRYEQRTRQASGQDQGSGDVQDGRPRRDDQRPRQGSGQTYGQGSGEGQEGRPRRDDQPRQREEGQRRPRYENGQANNGQANNGLPNGNDRTLDAASPVEADRALITPPTPPTEQASTVRAADMDAPAPRRRGRPRREDAAPPEGIEADRLPPSLSVSASAEPDTDAAEKPRRRRRATPATEAPPAS